MDVPFEDVDLGELRADLIFTSPPYFSVERYSDASSQSWVRYKTWASWVQGFLEPLVNKSRNHLISGGLFCVNTKNIRLGRNEHPIADEVRRIALSQGFVEEAPLRMPIGRVGKEARFEPLLLFRKS